MKANEIEIATSNVITLDYGEGNYPEIDAFIWYSSRKKYKRIRPDKPVSEFSPQIISELIHRLFMVKAVKDYSIQYEEQVDHKGRNLPTKKVAYLYLKEPKEQEADYEN